MSRIIGIIALLAGFILLALSLPDHLPVWGAKEERALIHSDMQEVHIDSADVDVRIVKEDREDLAVTLEGNGELKLTQQGTDLNISITRRRLSWFPFNTAAVIHLPESFGRVVSIDANHAQVTFAGESEEHKLSLERLKVKVDHGVMALMDVTLGELQLTMDKGRLLAQQTHINNSSMKIESGKVDLYRVDGSLHTELQTGVFEAESVSADEAEITVGKGDVSLSHFTGGWNASIEAGHMNVSNSSGATSFVKIGKGDFKLAGYKGDLEAAIDKGDIELSNYAGGLKADLGKGQMNIGLAEIVKPIVVRAASGDIRIELPSKGDFTLDAFVDKGTVDNGSSLPNTGETGSKKVFGGVSGQGTVPIALNSGDGNIHILSKGGLERQP